LKPGNFSMTLTQPAQSILDSNIPRQRKISCVTSTQMIHQSP